MLTKVQKWGDSLALRIPATVAAAMRLEDNSPVEISLIKSQMIITPVSTTDWTLEELLAGITQENLHTEIETGRATGNEIW
ncbi:AbrB/MazE/SpoVT family DNA-binding domain-containing protein [Roseiflexus sp.]